MMSNLSTEQINAINKLKKYKVGALFMEPGTGKTRTAIELINSSNAKLVLFMTPFRNKQNIEKEMKRWNCKIPYQIYGIESLSNSDNLYVKLINLLEKNPHTFMVVDESLKIKNAFAVRTKRINELGKLSEYRLILNGTPLSKNIIDVYAQMEFLSHKILNMDYEHFIYRYVEFIKYNNEYGNNFEIKDYKNLENLYSLIAPFVYDARLSITNKKTHKVVEYQINDSFEEYKYYKNYYINMIMENPNIFMAMTQKMQQSYCCEESKFDIVKHFLTDKTIIFCKFLRSKGELQKRFPKAKILTYGTGSLGLNLQNYNQIIFFDKTFNYAQKEQSERRIYRLGQNSDCRFIEMTGDVGLEKFIDGNIKNKTSLLDSFKEAVINNKVKVILDEL